MFNTDSSQLARRLCGFASGMCAVVWLGLYGIAGSRAAGAQNIGRSGNPDLYDSNRVLRNEIKLAPADWDALRQQERDVEVELSKARMERLPKSPYTWFPADVKIDGVELKKVGIRKRGFVGSADKDRPGLNLEFDKYVAGQQLAGQTSLKLHNNKQDGSNLRQALAYQLFNAAGVPAPRCNFALVTVNGQHLGVYSNLEKIGGRFLKRHFGSDAGNLYEAQISDFRPGWVRTFEKKTKGDDAKREELEAVVAALEADDAQLLNKLGRVVDLPAFISFWAVESLINHWDGFTGDQNNCFVYQDPRSSKLRFIPWGADGTFGSHHIFVPFEPPASVWAVSYLARRLYNHPETQKQYRARMEELLSTVWNEKQLLAEMGRMSKLLEGLSTVPLFQAAMQTEQLRHFISSRRAEIEPELKTAPQPWNFPMHAEPYAKTVGKISAQFSTAWVPSAFTPSPAGAKAHVILDFYGRRYEAEFTDVKAAPDLLNPQNGTVLLAGFFKGVEVPVSIWLSASTNLFVSGKSLDGSGSQSGILLVAGEYGKKDWRLLGTAGGGSTRFREAQMTPSAKVEGAIQTELSMIPWEDFDLAKLKKAP